MHLYRADVCVPSDMVKFRAETEGGDGVILMKDGGGIQEVQKA